MSQTEESDDGQVLREPGPVPHFLRPLPMLPSRSLLGDIWLRMFVQHTMQTILHVAALLLIEQIAGRAHVIRPCHPRWSYPLSGANGTLMGFTFPLPPSASWLDCWDIDTPVRDAQSGDTIIVPVEEMKVVVQERLQAIDKADVLLVVQSPLDLSVQLVSGQFAGNPGLLKHIWGGRAYIHVNEGASTGWVALHEMVMRSSDGSLPISPSNSGGSQ